MTEEDEMLQRGVLETVRYFRRFSQKGGKYPKLHYVTEVCRVLTLPSKQVLLQALDSLFRDCIQSHILRSWIKRHAR